jgi:predicted  nucleic acid-binding Zn-ribbon protein
VREHCSQARTTIEGPAITTCDECGSRYFAEASRMTALCPECAHHLYGYENCDHAFVARPLADGMNRADLVRPERGETESTG